MKIDSKGYYIMFIFISFMLCVFSLKLVMNSYGIFESAFLFIAPIFLEILDIFLNVQDDNGYCYKMNFEKKIELILLRVNNICLILSFAETALLFVFYEFNFPYNDILRMMIIISLWIYPLKYFVEMLINIYIIYKKNLRKAKMRG